jgi:hypothetical protein
MSFRLDRDQLRADLESMAHAVDTKRRRERVQAQQPSIDRTFVLVFEDLDCAVALAQ